MYFDLILKIILLVLAVYDQPVGAFRDEEAANGDEHGRHQRGRVHPPPGIEARVNHEHDGADGDAAHGADRLEGEGAKDKLATREAGDVLGDDHMCGRVVAAQRHADAEQADHQRHKALDHDQEREEQNRR